MKVVEYDSSDDEGQVASKMASTPKNHIMEQRKRLPVYKGRKHLIPSILAQQVSIIVGETGSGKSTQIPQLILDSDPKATIAVTQPRRVAAISLAGRVAAEMDSQVGQAVGYQVRFQAKYSPATKIRFVTDGMLMRELMLDEKLAKFNTIIIDEAHERTVITDLLLGMLKGLLKNGYKGRIIVMSATLDADTFREFFDNAPVFYAPGKTYPVERFYLKAPVDNIIEGVVTAITQLNHKEPTGDILVFLAGQEEIETIAERLAAMAPLQAKGVPTMLPVPLYAALSDKAQEKAFHETPKHHRKIVLATNIAETSLTIPGVRYVVDSGLRKLRVYRTKLGLETLLSVAISQASAAQRMGRAGREAPGKCYRLYTEKQYTEMEPFTGPEILRIAVSSPVLMLKNLGVENVQGFDWVEKPNKKAISNALLQLYSLGALDNKGHITALGREMVVLPLEPSLAAVLVKAKSMDTAVLDAVIDIVSCLSVQDLIMTPSPNRREEVNVARGEQFPAAAQYGDLVLIKQIWDYYTSLDTAREQKQWCKDLAINYKAIKTVKQVKSQLRGYLKITPQVRRQDNHEDSSDDESSSSDGNEEAADFDSIIKCFLAGFSTNVARGTTDRKYQTLLTQQPVLIHPSSALFGKRSPAIMYLEHIFTSKNYARIVSPINLEWLQETSDMFK